MWAIFLNGTPVKSELFTRGKKYENNLTEDSKNWPWCKHLYLYVVFFSLPNSTFLAVHLNWTDVDGLHICLHFDKYLHSVVNSKGFIGFLYWYRKWNSRSSELPDRDSIAVCLKSSLGYQKYLDKTKDWIIDRIWIHSSFTLQND